MTTGVILSRIEKSVYRPGITGTGVSRGMDGNSSENALMTITCVLFES